MQERPRMEKQPTDIIIIIIIFSCVLNRNVLTFLGLSQTNKHTHTHLYSDNGHYLVSVTNYCCCTGQ